MSFLHPAGKLHSRLYTIGVYSNQARRDFCCWLLKREPLESLTGLEPEEIDHLHGYFSARPDNLIKNKLLQFWREEFTRQNPEADISFFAEWLLNYNTREKYVGV